MPLKCVLTADPQRGPGYGLLRISGLLPGPDPLEPVLVSLESSQKGTFLNEGGHWQEAPASLRIPAPEWEGGQAVVSVGPTLFDALAQLPSTVRVRLTAGYAGQSDVGVLELRQPLRPSFAVRAEEAAVAAPPPPPPPPPPVSEPEPEPEPERPIVVDPDPIPDPEPVQPPEPIRVDPREDPLPPPVKTGGRSLLLGILLTVLLMLAAAAAVLWQTGALEDGGAAVAVTDGGINTREDLARYLGGNPGVDDLVETAQDLTQRDRLDLAMLVWQQAARQGSADAGLALGKMYDPETWSTATSPLPQADAETAAYWYEPAAAAGHVEAQRRLGKVLLRLAPGGSGPQADAGREWLQKAAAAGDAVAAAALK